MRFSRPFLFSSVIGTAAVWTCSCFYCGAFHSPLSTTGRHGRTTSSWMVQKGQSTLEDNEGVAIVVAGATGYIGRAVVREAVRQGYDTYALVRSTAKIENSPRERAFFRGSTLVQADVTNREELQEAMEQIAAAHEGSIDSIISCLASRTGVKKDAELIDYQATLHCLQCGQSPQVNVRHFVLLSAFCVRNPWLQFQKAKLRFEDALQKQTDLTYSIVRPTAYFKSLSGQLEKVQEGAPYVLFGDGEETLCNPISEADLATYIVDCVSIPQRENKILNIGGTDVPTTSKMQGEMLFRILGREPQYVTSPLWVFDLVIHSLQWLADVFQSEKLEDGAEIARIVKYYAVESMLTTEPSEKFGTMTLEEHYKRIVAEGQEYDPYTKFSFSLNVPLPARSKTRDPLLTRTSARRSR